jgi:hypothetical protein
MDTSDNDRNLIDDILLEHTRVPYAYGDIQIEPVFDRRNDRYLLVNVGWDKTGRVHGALVHVDLVEGKFWIQRDGTEDGVATELVANGIPKSRIVLAFRPPEIRKVSEFAVA